MIVCNDKGALIKGYADEVVKDFLHVTDAVHEALIKNDLPKKEVEEQMRMAFELGMMDEEEVNLAEDLMKLFNELESEAKKEGKKNGRAD